MLLCLLNYPNRPQTPPCRYVREVRTTLADQHEAMKKSAQSIWEAQLKVLKGSSDPKEDAAEQGVLET